MKANPVQKSEMSTGIYGDMTCEKLEARTSLCDAGDLQGTHVPTQSKKETCNSELGQTDKSEMDAPNKSWKNLECSTSLFNVRD